MRIAMKENNPNEALKRPYVKPQLHRAPIVSEEAFFQACKTNITGKQEWAPWCNGPPCKFETGNS
jgi:hypothetical protein